MNETDIQATLSPSPEAQEEQTPVPLSENVLPASAADGTPPANAVMTSSPDGSHTADAIEATAVPDILPEATAVPDILPEATAVPDILPEAMAAPDILPEATAVPEATTEAVATAHPQDVPTPSPFPWVPVVAIALLAVLAVAAALLLVGRKKQKPDSRQSVQQRPSTTPAQTARPRQTAPCAVPKSEPQKPTSITVKPNASGQSSHAYFSDADAENGKENQSPMNSTSSAPVSRYPVGYAQTVGRRPNQEDCYGVSTLDSFVQEFGLLAVVADGIGGLADGQVASKAIVHSMFDLLGRLPATLPAADRLLKLAAAAQTSVLDINHQANARCGSTLVSVLIDNGQLAFLSIGDSRIYLLRSGALLQLNREHEVGPGHDENVALGYTEKTLDARRRAALTSYVGKENLAQIDRNTQPLQLLHGDRILLVTDGVFGTLSDSELTACLSAPAQQAAEQVIAAVSAKGLPHQDNATIVIVDFP